MWSYGTAYVFAYALVFGMPTAIVYAIGLRPKPARIRVRLRGLLGELAARWAAGAAIAFALAPLIGLIASIVAAVIFGAVLAGHLWLTVPPDPTNAGPARSVRQDRAAALALACFGLLAFGPATDGGHGPFGHANGFEVLFFATISSAVVGAIVGAFVYGRLGAITVGVAGAGTGLLRGATVAVPLSAFAFYGTGIAFGVGVGLVALLVRAWGAYTLARLWFAVTGRLPLRFMRFLDDAHRRGVLRQSGTVYEFRHQLLHDHLRSGAK